MKTANTLLGGAFFAMMAATGVANAGSYTAPVAPVIVEETPQSWRGAYVGATVGYGFNGDDEIGVSHFNGAFTKMGNFDNEGWAGSLRAGYRWQVANWVFGPELALEAGQVGGDVTLGGLSAETTVTSALSLRYKAGYVVQDIDTMFYGIAGWSQAQIDYSIQGTDANGAVNIDDSYSAGGYILGVGVEKLLTDRLSVTGEYEYTTLGKDVLTDGLGNSTISTPMSHNLKFGLNLRF